MITKEQNITDAVRILKGFFPNKEPEVSVDFIFRNFGREKRKRDVNMIWLSNKLPLLRRYELVDSLYSYEGRKRLSGLKLTPGGQKALGLTEEKTNISPATMERSISGNKELSIDEIMDWVSKKRREHPQWKIVFNIFQPEE